MLQILQISVMAALAAASAFADVSVGAPAPAFTLTDSNGKARSLESFKGKTVVLEWLNYECPFVKKHYESKNMQDLQKEMKAEGVVWLSVISSAPGKQGYYKPAELNERNKKEGGAAEAILIDADGKVGKAYGAKTTPHMYVIDGAGKLVYQGAIDDKPSTDQADIKGARNYVREAVQALKKNEKIAVPSSKAYGCNVKYAG